jgi:transcriptional regulator with XRE-family HTH domain
MPSPLTAELGRTIRTLRSQRRLSARQLSELCITAGAPSLTRSTIAKIESGGRQSVTLDEVAALAQVFDVPPHAFFAAAQSAQSALLLGRPVKRVFIVYAEYDQSLAQTLKDLLEAWGFSAFFCRQEIREVGAAQFYQQELSRLLADADLVLLVLSNAFRYSTYCQVETGAATIDGKPVLAIIIPPVGLRDISQVSPVIERHEPIDASSPDEFVRVLERKLAGEISPERMPEVSDIPRLNECKQAVRSALASLIESYYTAPPTAALTGFWQALIDPAASRSIIAHIFRAIEDGETDVAIAGVSLKYSINILGEAIAGLKDSRDPTARPLLGPLNIRLVHMDEQSHILHSLKDTKDIDTIVQYFRVRWADTKASWEAAGKRAGVKLNIADPVAIDYIPQQVGVRIHSVARRWSVLYAGTCSFTKAGNSTQLLVGEREYEFHTSSIPNPYSSATRNFSDPAIEVFNQYIEHYSDLRNNGVALVLNNHEWLQRLERCVASYQDVHELIVVSNTCQKLLPLIALALNRGIAVRIYVAAPGLPSSEASLVRDLPKRLKEEMKRRGLGRPDSGTPELLHLRHVPTFRAALIGDAVLGFEPYVVAPRIENPSPAKISDSALAGDNLVPAGLRVIATKYSDHFEELRAMVREQYRDAESQGVIPYL